jgi:glycosyltransferase involved in cell wall biosynthesis
MKSSPLVSIVIPAKNSGAMLENCLKSIKSQTYKNVEVIIVDAGSRDNTKIVAKRYKARLYNYYPRVPKGTFDAPYRRNFGIKKAKGKYVYYVDADMELTENVVKEAVGMCENGYSAIIVHEDSFGEGVWASAKNLERRCIWGDDTQESPRFVNKEVWNKLGGLDELLGGGGDDWDFFQKLKDGSYKVGWVKSLVMHNEGKLSLYKLMKKRFMYGRDSVKYIKKRPSAAVVSYFPIRKCYIVNWKRFLVRPVDSFYFIIMRTCEYVAAFAGILYSLFKTK